MFAEDTRASKTDVRWGMTNGFFIFHTLHRVMNECKRCERKKVIKSRKCDC
jgi:hypothetical protein